MDERADKTEIAIKCEGKTLFIGTGVTPDHPDFLRQWNEVGDGVVYAWKVRRDRDAEKKPVKLP